MKLFIPDSVLNPAKEFIAGFAHLSSLNSLKKVGGEKAASPDVKDKADQRIELISLDFTRKTPAEDILEVSDKIAEAVFSLIRRYGQAKVYITTSAPIANSGDASRTEISPKP